MPTAPPTPSPHAAPDAQALRRWGAGLSTQDMAALLALGGYGKLGTAAQALDVAPASLSQRLKGIEQRLGAPLFKRSAAGMQANQLGELVLAQVRELAAPLDALAALTEGLRAGQAAPRITISCPGQVGEQWLQPLLLEFMARHPGLRTHLEYDNRWHDLNRTPVDLVFRQHRLFANEALPPYAHVARRVLQRPQVLCAAAGYLAALPAPPATPADLAGLHCLDIKVDLARDWALPASDWRFRAAAARGKAAARTLVQQVPVRHSVNTAGALLQAVRAGLGVAVLPLDMVQPDLAAGRLQPLLPGYRLPSLDLYLIEPYVRAGPLQKQLVAFLLRRLRAITPA
ncbi:MAG: LysR family transcriptional regulator [Aquincola tertiaricarbonis]